MELEKKGYKQTKIGLIPEDWKIVSLGEITNLLTNGFVGTATTHYTEERNGVLYIQGYNVECNSFNFRGIKKVTQEFHKNHQKSSLKEGDLLTVQTGDVGLTTIIPEELIGSNCHALIISRFKKNKVSPSFYSHYFNSTVGRSRLKSLEVGTTMKHLNVSDMMLWKIPFPPTLSEQKAIATALNDVDTLIRNLEKLISKKKGIKQGAIQQLLTHPNKGGRRLPGFSEEWEEKRLGEIADFYKGKGLPKADLDINGRFPCIHYGELFTFYNEIVYEINSKTNQNQLVFLSKVNDVLMPTSDVTPNGLATASAIFEDDVILGGDVLVIRTFKSILNGGFLSYLIRINKGQVMQLVSGTTVYHLYGSDMKKFRLSFPSIKEQNLIVSILQDIDKEIQSLKNKRTKYQNIKQGMMQELLTGKTRLV